MVAKARYIEKFEDANGITSYTFPLNLYEWETSQQFRNSLSPVIGGDYAYDFHRNASAPKDVAIETVRFANVGASAGSLEALIDTMRSSIHKAGRGKLWTLGSDGSRRWAWARPREMPTMVIGFGRFRYSPHIISFVRESDWNAESQTLGTQLINAAGTTTFNIVVGGNADVDDVVFRFRSNAAAGWVDVAMLNTSNGYQFSTSRDGTAVDHELKVDCGARSVKFSVDNGASYTNDYANFVYGSQQIDFMRLAGGGTNIIKVWVASGTPNFNLEWAFNAKYH